MIRNLTKIWEILIQMFMKVVWRPPSLSKLKLMIFVVGLTHLDYEASIYTISNNHTKLIYTKPLCSLKVI